MICYESRLRVTEETLASRKASMRSVLLNSFRNYGKNNGVASYNVSGVYEWLAPNAQSIPISRERHL